MRLVVCVVLCCLFVVLSGCSGTGVGPTDTPGSHTLGGDTAGRDDTVDSTPLATGPDANGTLGVHFVDVGQGDATLVVAPSGETMLVDTGDYEDDGELVVDYLRRHGIDRIDHLVTTHADADHIGGHAAVIEYLETEGDGVGAVYDPGIAASTRTYEAYLDAVERYDVPLYETHAGDDVPLAGVEIDVLGPPEEYLERRDRNENSIVLRVGFGKTSFLLTGDAETGAEQWLVERYGDRLDTTVLKVGHHGSSSSTSESFLDTVSPDVAVVSSAYDSQYGHPHEEVLARLAERSIPTFWTATHGTVVVRSDGQRLTVATQQTAPTDPRELRSGTPIPPGTTGALEPRLTLGSETGPVTASETAPTTAVATDGGAETADDAAALGVVEVHADAAGRDGENLNDEYVVFENTGEESLTLAGWTVHDEAGHEYTFGDVTLAPGARVTLHTGSGTDTASDLFWASDGPLWNNDGDTVTVETANGVAVLVERYD